MSSRVTRVALAVSAASLTSVAVALASVDPRASATRIATPPLPTAQQASGCPSGKVVHEQTITKARWVRGFAITEYYSTPERWFTGRKVVTPGLQGRHRVDWLYSARGVSMQGDGIGLDGRHYHIDALGSGGWVNRKGHHTRPGRCASRWSRGRPVWLQGGWRNKAGGVTYPLAKGGWSNGTGDHERAHGGATFAKGSSLPLRAYRTLAVDSNLIPRGSRVYIPYYKRHGISSGWFVAQDTGGAIIGRHIDVYRPPTEEVGGGGRFLQRQRIYVDPPG